MMPNAGIEGAIGGAFLLVLVLVPAARAAVFAAVIAFVVVFLALENLDELVDETRNAAIAVSQHPYFCAGAAVGALLGLVVWYVRSGK
jgi:hypothetical protein